MPPYPPPPSGPPPDATSYPQPPSYEPPAAAPPPTPASQRSPRTLIAAVVAVVIVLVALVGYGISGYAYASSRISSAHHSLNTVIEHQNSITKSFNDLAKKLSEVNISSSTTAADLKNYRGLSDQLVSSSQAAVPTVASDDALLVSASRALNEQQWLTVLSRGRLDQESNRIRHARKALAAANTIASDYVQLGQFYQAFFDGNIDLDTIGTKASANDLAGALTATTTLKADAAKGLSLAKAPGLPSEVEQYETDLGTLAADFEKLLIAIGAGNTTAGNTYLKAVEADAAKVDGHDWKKIGDQIAAFYKPLIDNYNAEGLKATG